MRNLPNVHSEDRSRRHRGRGKGSNDKGECSLTACCKGILDLKVIGLGSLGCVCDFFFFFNRVCEV